MAAELDEELEQVTRESFARMIGAIRVTPPDEVPDATVARPAVVDVDDRRRRTRSRAVVVAAAGIAAVAAAATAVVLLPGDDSDRVENAPASSDDTVPDTTVETTPSTTPTTVDTTDDTTDPGATDTGDPPDETWPASGEVRGAELRDRLDQATSDVPLDRLTDVVQLEATNGPAALQVGRASCRERVSKQV